MSTLRINPVGRLIEVQVNEKQPIIYAEKNIQVTRISDSKVVILPFNAQALELTDIYIDGAQPESYDDLKAMLAEVFPNANSGDGGSGDETPTLGDVLIQDNDAAGRQIKNISDPSDDQDVVSKKFYEDNLPAPFSGSYNDLSDKPDIPVLPLQFVAQIEQGGDAADPTIANVMINTLGGNPVVTRTGVGQYQCTLAGAFPIGKTVLSVTPKQVGDFFMVQNHVDVSEDFVIFTTSRVNLGAGTIDLSDGAFTAPFSNIRIEVYP